MTFADFRARYGAKFYEFINSELGVAFLMTLEKNDPATRVVDVPPAEQTANSTLFLGQITGWRDCVLAIQHKLILTGEGPQDVEATYEGDALPFLAPKPTPEPAAPAAVIAPAPKRSKKRK